MLLKVQKKIDSKFVASEYNMFKYDAPDSRLKALCDFFIIMLIGLWQIPKIDQWKIIAMQGLWILGITSCHKHNAWCKTAYRAERLYAVVLVIYCLHVASHG